MNEETKKKLKNKTTALQHCKPPLSAVRSCNPSLQLTGVPTGMPTGVPTLVPTGMPISNGTNGTNDANVTTARRRLLSASAGCGFLSAMPPGLGLDAKSVCLNDLNTTAGVLDCSKPQCPTLADMDPTNQDFVTLYAMLILGMLVSYQQICSGMQKGWLVPGRLWLLDILQRRPRSPKGCEWDCSCIFHLWRQQGDWLCR